MAQATIPLALDSYFTYTISLAGQAYLFEFEWKDRLGALYLSVYGTNGQPIVQGKALRPGASFTLEERGGPPGVFGLNGPANQSGDYTRKEVRDGVYRLDYFNDRAGP